MGDPFSVRSAVHPLPRRLEFVRPRLLQNGLVHHETKPIAKLPAPSSRLPIDTRWSQTFGAASGLHNLGNTCFLNSILQCLTHTAPLANFLLAHSSPCSKQKGAFCFLCFLKGHIPAALGGGQPRAPRALVANLRLLSRSFKPGRQEDAHEFLCKCLEALQNSCQPKLVDAVFGGRFRSRVRCQSCSYASDAFDPFQDIALEIQRASSVEAALRHFTAPELLTGHNKYLCGGCRQRVVADKRLTIAQAPAVLTVQLKRFTYTGSKIAKPVQYGHRLDLGPFLSDPGQQVAYQLFGLVVHIGSGPRSGHYVAYVKSAAGPWYMMDDAGVRKIGADAVLKQSPYLLFYIRDAPPKPSKLPDRKSVLKSFNEILVEKPEPIAPSVSGGNAIPNEVVAGGDRIEIAAVVDTDERDEAPTPRRRVPLPLEWRYRRLRPSCLPIGQVVMKTLKSFKTVQPISLATWDDHADQSAKMRILREYRDQTALGHRSEYDRDYDLGRVRKVKNRQHISDATNRFQDIVNKRIRSS